MVSARQAAKLFLPPILTRALRRPVPARPGPFQGDYGSWAAAAAAAEGYNAASILEVQLAAARKVRDGKAVYERDSVCFDDIEYSFPVLASLLYVASRNGEALTVLDFGGALGSSYFQNRGMLSHFPRLRWCVVEQPHFVARGKAEFETEQLRFYATVDECMKAERPHVVLLSSVLQYLEAPFTILAELADKGPDFILIDRHPSFHYGPEQIVVQTVPPQIYPATYACRLFARGAVEEALRESYEVVYQFEAHAGTTIEVGERSACYGGAFLSRR